MIKNDQISRIQLLFNIKALDLRNLEEECEISPGVEI